MNGINLVPTATTQEVLGDPYLLLQLTPSLPVLLPMTVAQEALVVDVDRLTPIPNMPASILGLLNRRSRAFWVADLGHLLGFPPQRTNIPHYHIVLIQVASRPLALVVAAVKGVRRFAIHSERSTLDAAPPTMTPFLAGGIPHHQDMLFILDPEAILNAAMSASTTNAILP